MELILATMALSTLLYRVIGSLASVGRVDLVLTAELFGV